MKIILTAEEVQALTLEFINHKLGTNFNTADMGYLSYDFKCVLSNKKDPESEVKSVEAA